MKPELHLPDLPQVEVAIGAASAFQPAPIPWPVRLRVTVSSYLPILLMALLALATLWLVQNTPVRPPSAPQAPVRHEPDYEMEQFVAQRYAPDGRLVMRIEGKHLRHYPDTDEIEVDVAHVQAWSDEGRETVATARSAIAKGDSSEFRLLGGAVVTSDVGREQPLIVRGEFLQVFPKERRVFSDQPVVVVQGTSELHAQGIDYDHDTQVARLAGRVTGHFEPGLARRPAAAASAPTR